MKKNAARPAKPSAPPADTWQPFRLSLWLLLFAGALFFWPQCLDRYLAPRFLFVSLVMAGVFWELRTELLRRADWRLNTFDLLVVLWYGLNLASVSWAFSWSEGVFFAQKVWLFLLAYWLFRQCFFIDENAVRQTLSAIFLALSVVAGLLVTGQLMYAATQHSLDNDALYDYASGLFGNKGLASDFLFLLLVFNGMFYADSRHKKWLRAISLLLLLLLLLLQTRTVYLAVGLSAVLYFSLRAAAEPAFRPVFLKKILPAGLAGLALLLALVAWKGRGTSLGERLNPLTYLESASANERRFVWYKTDLLNKEHYWLGVGNGSWKFWFPSKGIRGGYRLEQKNIVFTRAHNDYLEIRAEMGLIGITVFCGLFVLAAGAGLFYLRKTAGGGAAARLSMALAGLAGYCIIQFFDFPRERVEMQLLLGLLFALTIYETRRLWAALPGISIARSAKWLLIPVLAGLAFNLLIGYYRVRGEIHNVAMMQALVAGKNAKVLEEAKASRNSFYQYNDTALPFEWFEGIVYLQMRQNEPAVNALAEAYRLNPWSFQVINNYASALATSRQYEQAATMYEQALDINPRYGEGQLNLAFARLKLGDTLRAAEIASRLDTIPGPQNDEDRAKNRQLLEKRAELMRLMGRAGQ
ncbi:MAG: O-antigen ligase family protein [Saprospiraceae bacterium]